MTDYNISQVVPIIFTTEFIIGFVGNALVILVIAVNSGRRSTMNILIFFLALADIIYIILKLPCTATNYVMPRWQFGQWWCKVVQYLIVVTSQASVYTLVIISLDRYIAVVHPIAAKQIRTEKNSLLLIAGTWVFFLTTAIPVAICHVENYSSCVILAEHGSSKLGFQVLSFLVSYVFPLSIMTYLYKKMIGSLGKSGLGGRVSANRLRRQKRVTRMVVVLLGLFAVCWFPIQIILLIKAIFAYKTTDFTLMAEIMSHVLAFMNSCINPVLCVCFNKNLRMAFRKLMDCRHTRPQEDRIARCPPRPSGRATTSDAL